ncbi:MAG: DUF362 domain-containing protein [Chloroflexi bacterium]|nr:DUF362 domain-containing protein [Chloroflexota bacterium]
MRLARYQDYLSRDAATVLKINISWQHFYPACSTTPWQLDGVIRALNGDGFTELVPVQNGTVVVDARVGEVNNGHKAVLDKHGLASVHLEEPPVKWLPYVPKKPLLALDRIFPEGIHIPDVLIGKNVVHLPTMKTHVFTTMTGSMKNAFGGLLNHKRHWTHSVIHETLVDLLTIQREIHPGIFTVTDGTFAGDGPGPRAMRPHVKNLLLASADPVAIDAVAARVMGFRPLSLKFLRLAHERGLGCADPAQIEMVGEDISGVNWHFSSGEDTLASRGQKLIYWGPLKPLEKALLRSAVAPWSYLASDLYYNHFWYRFIGRRRLARALDSGWGQLFCSYMGSGAAPARTNVSS